MSEGVEGGGVHLARHDGVAAWSWPGFRSSRGSQRHMPASVAVTLSRCSMRVPQFAQSGQSGGWVQLG
ncbi:hypothetical protein AB0D54_28270 [Streptomyces xanthophaeus]|uniref:hypothetical protein n=1 Tax=Streptomyces xanthophaeus TaxID=67385 RepID=UPI00342F4526